MRKLIFPVLLFFCITSCRKDDIPPRALLIVQPGIPKLLDADTLFTGNFWGLTIGSTPDKVYARLQSIKTEKQISSLDVAGNVFNDIRMLENRIGLYQSLFLNELPPTATGVQLAFAQNKVKSIHLTNGTLLTRWPDVPGSVAIETGEPLEGVYKKLQTISSLPAYKRKFQRIAMFAKNIEMVYDPSMSDSPQWYVGSVVDARKGYRLQLNFQNGKLYSIEYALYENR